MLNRVPIRLKLTIINVVSSALALLLAFSGFLYYDLTQFKSRLSAELRTEAQVVGTNCTAALAFNNKPAAQEILRALKSRKQIEVAALYAPDGHLFASYDRATSGLIPSVAQPEGVRYDANAISVFSRIRGDKNVAGTLYLRSGMEEWTARRDSFTLMMGSLVFLCALTAFGIGWRLQEFISGPILELTKAMRSVSNDERYDRRVPRKTDDEIGELVDGFNSMLAEIEERDRHLHAANEELETRVRERTGELEREIAERRAAEESLTKSQRSLEDFFENAAVGMHWLAPDGTILRVNRAELEMLGYARDEYVGHNIAEFHEDGKIIKDVLEKLASHETVLVYESRMLCRDGRTKHVAIESNVFWEGDTFVHTRCFTRDLTEQIEAERARKEREQAEQANRAKNEFLSRMSHELRTPMNAIMGFGQLLAMDELTPDQRDSVDRLIAAGRHLLKLINEVLDISRIEAGNLGISKEPVKVADVVQEVCSLVSPLTDQKRIALVNTVRDDDDTHVLADRQRLRQVLLNLVSNAIKYNVEFGEVHVETERIGTNLRLRVRDTGPGIAREKAALIFTPFERLGAEQTTIEGTGLGLALSKRLTEAMGGEIGLLPTKKGACFHVDLPLADSPLQLLDSSLANEPAETARLDGNGTTVLLIEDNLSNVRLMEKILGKRAGFRLVLALTGESGLELAQKHRPDIVLLDLNLPDMQGDEVLADLKASEATKWIPVIVVSADATPSQMSRIKASGAIEYLTKPVDVDALLQAIDGSLNSKVKRSA